jgi:alkanesulfonate monooxygenase SsuD/methylene tetrahydromethanopterin reductase-like flavin-dependent oxidoreductase (luciferase family)
MSLNGTPATWADQLARISEELRFSTLLVGVPQQDPVTFVRRLGEDTAPRLRELLG